MGQGAGVRGWAQPPVSAAPGAGGGVTGSSDASLTIAGADAIINVAHSNVWSVQQRFINPASGSTSVGGAINVDATGGVGAGIIAYTNRGADAAGRLMNLRVDNPANPQSALNVNYSGAGHAVTIQHTPVGGVGSEALDVTSTNRSDTAVGITGVESGRGTLKVTHSHPVGALAADDANAAILRLNFDDAAATGTAVQGIVLQSEPGGPVTTGDLIRAYAGPIAAANPKLRLTAAGAVYLDAGTILGGPASGQSLTLTPNDSGAGVAASVIVNLTGDRRHTIQINQAASLLGQQVLLSLGQAGTIGAAGQLRGLSFGPALTFSGLVAAGPLLLFNASPTVTLDTAAANTNLNAITYFIHQSTYDLGLAATNYGLIQSAGLPFRIFGDAPSFVTNASGALAQMNAGYDTQHQKIINIGTGWSFTGTLAHVHTYAVQAGAGTAAEHVAHDIEDLATWAGLTAGISIRSKGANVTMRHLGAAILGATTAPGTGLILDAIGKAYTTNTRQAQSDHIQPAATSYTVAVDFEIVSGVTYELAADAILDIT